MIPQSKFMERTEKLEFNLNPEFGKAVLSTTFTSRKKTMESIMQFHAPVPVEKIYL